MSRGTNFGAKSARTATLELSERLSPNLVMMERVAFPSLQCLQLPPGLPGCVSRHIRSGGELSW